MSGQTTLWHIIRTLCFNIKTKKRTKRSVKNKYLGWLGSDIGALCDIMFKPVKCKNPQEAKI